MNDIRIEFEDLGFSTLYPYAGQTDSGSRRVYSGNRKALVANVEKQIAEQLRKDGVTARVVGREKHLYSIYQKMRSKSRSFTEIMDVFAV